MRTAHLSVVAVSGLVAALGVACKEAQRPPALPPVAAHPSSVPAAPPAPVAAAAAPLASSALEPSPVVTEKQPQLSDRTASPGSTRGTIACSDRRCAAEKELCVFGPDSDVEGRPSGFRCVAPEARPTKTIHATYRCDDGTDCPRGETCCGVSSSVAEIYECVPRGRVARVCNFEACEEGGAACPKGLTCREGRCAADVRAECGPERGRCPADRPLCSYSAKESKCVTSDEANVISSEFHVLPYEEPAGVYTCSRASDCGGGGKCCATQAGRLTYCAPACDVSNGMRVCTALADCTEIRALCGNDAECRASLKCTTVSPAPPWIRMCTTVSP